MKFVLHQVEPRQGLRWLHQGWQAFRHAPLPMTALLASYFMLAMLLSLIGAPGGALALLAAPMLTLVFMLATHQVLQKRPVSFALWLHPFRLGPARSATQLRLGLLFLALGWLLMWAVESVDGAAVERLNQALQAANTENASPEKANAAKAAVLAALADPDLFEGALWRLLGAAVFAVPFWHASALVHWGGHGVMKALFGSCLGLWHNRGAYTVHALGWCGVLLVGGFVLAVVMLAAPGLALALATPLSLLMGTVFYAGLYFSFADTFRLSARLAEPPPP